MQATGEQIAKCLYLDNAQIIAVPMSMCVAGVVIVWASQMTMWSEEIPEMQVVKPTSGVHRAGSGVAFA